MYVVLTMEVGHRPRPIYILVINGKQKNSNKKMVLVSSIVSQEKKDQSMFRN